MNLLRIFRRPSVKAAAVAMNEHRLMSEKERIRAVTAQMRREMKLPAWESKHG